MDVVSYANQHGTYDTILSWTFPNLIATSHDQFSTQTRSKKEGYGVEGLETFHVWNRLSFGEVPSLKLT